MTFPWPFAILVKIPWLFQKFQKMSKFQKFHDFSMTVATLLKVSYIRSTMFQIVSIAQCISQWPGYDMMLKHVDNQGSNWVSPENTLTVHIVEGALFITVSCLHLWTNSTAFTHWSGETWPRRSKMKTKYDLTQFEDNSDRTTCTVSVKSVWCRDDP